jgi:hypothetical protein
MEAAETQKGAWGLRLTFAGQRLERHGAIATVLQRNGVCVFRAAAVSAKSETGQHHVRLLTLWPAEGNRGIARLYRGMGAEKGKNIVLPVTQ